MLSTLIKKFTNIVLGAARPTDPDTSIIAAQYERTTIQAEVLRIIVDHWGPELEQEGWTGHELAKAINKPLNSVTPRLAPLVRLGKIKDSGVRRDGQIIWVEC